MKRPTYRAAIEWLAMNGASDETLEDIQGAIPTALVADMFGVELAKVAADIARARKAIEP